MQADTLITDKAFDADERVIAPLAAAGKTAVIPPKANRRLPRDYDQYIYQARHLIENFFANSGPHRSTCQCPPGAGSRQPRGIYGNFVAIVVMNGTLASSGRRAI